MKVLGMALGAALLFFAGAVVNIRLSEPYSCPIGSIDDATTIGTAMGTAIEWHIRQHPSAKLVRAQLITAGPSKEFVIPAETEQNEATFVIDVDGSSYFSFCSRSCYCDVSPYTPTTIKSIPNQ